MKSSGASNGTQADLTPAVRELLDDLGAIESVAVSVMDTVASLRGRIRAMSSADFGELVDIAEMAKRLGISPSTLSQVAREHPDRVPSYTFGSCVRFSPREVLEASRRRAR